MAAVAPVAANSFEVMPEYNDRRATSFPISLLSVIGDECIPPNRD
jgi:hypothetical protein